MKNVSLSFILLIAFLGSFILSSAMEKSSQKDFIGTWKFEVEQAPYGYDRGEMKIVDKEGKLSVVVKFEDGSQVFPTGVKMKEGKMHFEGSVDYEYFTVELTSKEKVIKGKVFMTDGELPLKAWKPKK